MNPHGKFQAHKADGGTGWAIQEMMTRKNIYTKTNPSLSLEFIPLLQGNAETEDHMLISGKGNLSVDSVYLYIFTVHV